MWKLPIIASLFASAFGFGTRISESANFNPVDAMYATQMAGATYCPAEDLASWTCAHCTANLTNIEIISEDTQVVMGMDNDRCVVAFRGSSDIENWISNFQFAKTEPYDDSSVSVHHGLYEEYEMYKDRVLDFISRNSDSHKEIFITGHSSGAAVAMFLAYDLMISGQMCTVFTLGKPRIGNAAFGESIDESLMTHYRITHSNDIVPHLPEEVLGFTHTTHEVWYPDDGADKYIECEGSEYSECSNSCAPLSCVSVDDHLTYLGVRIGGGGC